jgi:acyl-CoA hydrolase
MTSPSARRTQIIEQLAHLDTMEYGCLRAEHRPASGFQHQVWEHGKNLSQRIPADEAPALQTAIANRQLAEALAQEYIAVTVQWTRESADDATLAKKNARSWRRPSLRKPKRS